MCVKRLSLIIMMFGKLEKSYKHRPPKTPTHLLISLVNEEKVYLLVKAQNRKRWLLTSKSNQKTSLP